MFNRIISFSKITAALLLLVAAGCKKGTFDINSPNPNLPSSVSPKFVLSAALASTAQIIQGGDQAHMNLYMGYWATSGDYIPDSRTLTYNTTTSYQSDNWNSGYITLKNFQEVQDLAAVDPLATNYAAIGKIMQAFLYGYLVDQYNNLPYFDALKGGTVNFPKFDDAATVYTHLITNLDSAVIAINSGTLASENPGKYDIMFGGNMTSWIQFAHTVKLRLLMNLTETSGGPAAITSGLSGLTASDFIQADAQVNPGYTNAVTAQQSPFYSFMGYTPSGSVTGGNSYYRACKYGVDFYTNTNDTIRQKLIYALNQNGIVQGRDFGSVGANEHNVVISGMGPGILISASQNATVFPYFEALFLQAEAAQRGYLTGDPKALYAQAVTASFAFLGDANASADATALISQSDDRVNFASSANPLNTLILQEWAAVNGIDPLAAWNNWRRMGIPSDLPISVYPGTTATHAPYRLLYPDTEYSYNATNVNAEGSINNITSKIFWMP